MEKAEGRGELEEAGAGLDLEVGVDVFVDEVECLSEAGDEEIEQEQHDDDAEEGHHEPCEARDVGGDIEAHDAIRLAVHCALQRSE